MATDEKTYSMWALEADAKEVAIELLQSGDDPDDVAHSAADSCVPIYTYDLMMYAASDISLATEEPECGPAFDGSPTPVNIIAANIYDRLYTAASEAVDEWIEEREDDDS